MRWCVLGLLFLARIGMGFQFQTVTSVGDNLVATLGLDYAGVGMLIGIFMAPGLFLALPAGIAGRFASDRAMTAAGLVALTIGGLVSGLAADSWTIGLGRVIAGTGFLLSSLYFTKMIADWFDGKEIATAMSLLVMSWPFGIAMGQIGHVWLAELYSWRAPFFAASAYCLLAALSVWFLYEPPRRTLPTKSGGPERLNLREWALIACAGCAWSVFNAGYVVYLTFAPKVLEAAGQSVLQAAGIVSIASWVMIFSGALCGQIADRFGRHNLILAICMGAAIAALALIGIPGFGLPSSLLFGLIGMAPAGVIMALTGRMVRPERRAFGMGVFLTFYHAVMMIVPPFAGALFDATGSTAGPIHLGMALFALAVPVSLLFQFIASRSPASVRTDP